MPEGHTIHRLANDLNSSFKNGPVVATSPQGPFAMEASQLDGTVLKKAEAHGKHLFIHFADTPSLHVHLGLIGKFRRKEVGAEEIGAIRLRLSNEKAVWDLTGPMTCALVDDDDIIATMNKLGPDPLRKDPPDVFIDKLSRSSKPIAAALLDQAVVSGVGNVFRSEFCYLMGIRPSTPSNQLTHEQAISLWDLAVDKLQVGVKLNRIVTREPKEVGTTAAKLNDDERLYVYKREGLPCQRCSDEIILTEIAKRKAWYCPTCQQ